jgi:copper chaperone CopZ
VALLVIWLIVAFGMRIPSTLSTRTYAVPSLTANEAETLLMRLRLLPGVREAQVLPAQGTAFLKVDSADFDEQNVLQTITGKVS